MCLTSCEGTLDDIFGEWSRPSGNNDNTKTSVTSIELNKETLELAAGETGQLTATVDPSGSAVTWSSDKEEVATVDANGLVTAVAAGIATITAKAGDKTATCEVTVTANPAAVPLTLEAITAGTIKVTSPQDGMQYSLNGGAKTAVTSTAIDVAVGDKVAFYGNGTSITKYNGTKITGGTAEVKVYGNIMSLVDETGFATNTKLTSTYTFDGLFAGTSSSDPNTTLKDASGLLLPATTLTKYCYQNMFKYCTALTAVPELKATTLADGCYGLMFYGCANLTTAPELKATTLASYCYTNMFLGCTSLTTAPELKATTLAEGCYLAMFYNCTQLTTAPELKATTLAENCYKSMFFNCTQLTTAPELKATTLVKNCYNSMFYNCGNLNSVTCLATDISADYCTESWLYNVPGTGTFTKASGMDWSGKTGSAGIPSGWTVNEQ